MHRVYYFFILMILVFYGCSKSPVVSGRNADHNKYNLMYVKVGMSEIQVLNIMGDPHMKEVIHGNGHIYDVWYYLTKGYGPAQQHPIPQNFTPLIFKDGFLEGFGYYYLRHIQDSLQQEHPKAKNYTNDEEEWPKNEHGYVPSPEETKQTSPEKPTPTYEKQQQKSGPIYEKQQKEPEPTYEHAPYESPHPVYEEPSGKQHKHPYEPKKWIRKNN